ncbi:MAG: FTR1 family protein [Candidatus Krumholzibacteria bacterium]
MLSTTIIVFREVLEMSLILGVVLVATRGLVGRGRWLTAGLVAGVAGSCIVALSAGAISDAISGMGQEVFNASVLLLAAVLIGWTVVWMKRHAMYLAQRLKAVGEAVAEGKRPLYIIAVVMMLAILREGSEIVLLTYGVLLSGQTVLSVVTGGLLGLVAGALIGAGIYFGLIKMATRYFFSVTGVLLTFLAAAMVSQAVQILGSAGFIPVMTSPLWDSSWLLSERGMVGSVLQTLVGYSAQPTGIQLAAYLATLGVIGLLLKSFGGAAVARVRGTSQAVGVPGTAGVGKGRGARAAVIGVLIAGMAGLVLPVDAVATKKVYSPNAEYRELEVEARGSYDVDDNALRDGKQKQKYAVGYGFTERWFTEIYGEIEKSPGDDFEFTAIEWEHRLRLFEPGEKWLDVGLYAAYEWSLQGGHADKFEAKVLLQKEQGRLLHITNLILEQQVGSHATEATEAGLAWSTRYRLRRNFEPGVELHSNFGELKDIGPYRDQTHLLGPVFYGKLGKMKYDVGYLFGISSASPNGTLKWILEYEFYF